MVTLEQLDAEIARLETAKRWNDVVRALQERASRVEGAARIETLLKQMVVLRDRFANHALAIEAARGILALDPRHQEALAYLRDVYRKRRMHAELADLEAQTNVTSGPAGRRPR